MSFINSIFNFIFSHYVDIYIVMVFLGFSILLSWYSFVVLKQKKYFTKSDKEFFVSASIGAFIPVLNFIFVFLSFVVFLMFLPEKLREIKYPQLKTLNKIIRLTDLHRKHFHLSNDEFEGYEDFGIEGDEDDASKERRNVRSNLMRLQSAFKNHFKDDAFILLLVRYDYAFNQILDAVEKCRDVSLKATEEIFASSQHTFEDVLSELEILLERKKTASKNEISNLTQNFKSAIEQERIFQQQRKNDPVVIALSKKL